MPLSSIWKNMPAALARAFCDILLLSIAQLGELMLLTSSTIMEYTYPMFVWSTVLDLRHSESSKFVICPKMPILLRIWLLFTFIPYGIFGSVCSYSAELFFGMKLGWRIFVFNDRVERYKYFNKAMNRFDFNFYNIFNMNQELIDTTYREKRNTIMNDNDSLSTLDESFYILSSFSSYWMYRRIGCVNLWMYYLFTNSQTN